jgi:optic atrophy 3 protein
MYRTEVRLRTSLLGEPAKHVRPLSETRCVPHVSLIRAMLIVCYRAIENGANALAEGFLFAVAAGLILAETYRSARSTSKRRDDVDDQLESLSNGLSELKTRVDAYVAQAEETAEFERQKCVFCIKIPFPSELTDRTTDRHEELSRILERVVEIGLRGGWAEFEQDPIKFPRTSLTHPPPRDPPSQSGPPSSDSTGNDSSSPDGSSAHPTPGSSSSSPSAGSSVGSSNARVQHPALQQQGVCFPLNHRRSIFL